MKNFVVALLLIFAFSAICSARTITGDSTTDLNEKNDEWKSTREKFEKFAKKFLKDQSTILDDSDNNMDQLKLEHDSKLREIEYEMSRIDPDNTQADKRKEIADKIQRIKKSTNDQFEALREEERMLDNDLHLKRIKINEKKHGLEQFIDGSNDPHMKILFEQQLIGVNGQLASLDADYLELSKKINTKLRDLKVSSAIALNENYKNLISFYEEEERDTENANRLKDSVIEQWKSYAEGIENARFALVTSLKDFSSKSLNFESLMKVDDLQALQNYHVTYPKTRLLMPKNARGLADRYCNSYILDGDDLIADNCAAADVEELQLTFKNVLYTCQRSEQEMSEYYVYHLCGIQNEINQAPCVTFDLNDDIITGHECEENLTRNKITIDGYRFKCEMYAFYSSEEYQFRGCRKIFDDIENYVVTRPYTKFYIPKTKSGENEVPCGEFTRRDEDDLFTDNCKESESDLPKLVTLNGKEYNCFSIEFSDKDYFIYGYCIEIEATTALPVTTTDEPLNQFRIPHYKVYNTQNELNSYCRYYVIDYYEEYHPLDCQSDEKGDIFVFNGINNLRCSELIDEVYYLTFGDCNFDDTNPSKLTTESLSLEFSAVTDDTIFYIPIAKSENDEIIPCTSFSYKLNENRVYASNCRENEDYSAKAVNFNGVVYNCKKTSKERNSFTPLSYYTLTECSYANSLGFEWKEFHDTLSHLPRNVVEAGRDADGKSLHVIRKAYSDKVLYGKSVNTDNRKNGYITNDKKEMPTHDYEILTADHYAWCEYDPFRSYSSFPVCRAPHLDTLTPGTLLDDGTCRVGYNWGVHEKTSGVEILIIGRDSCWDEGF